MQVGAISAAGLSQYVLSSSNSTQLQQALQTLQSSLSSGDLNGAQAAFGTLQQLNQSLATASGNSLSSNSQLSTDLTALGSALTAGDLSTAQSAFATVQSDLKSSNSPSQTNEINRCGIAVRAVGPRPSQHAEFGWFFLQHLRQHRLLIRECLWQLGRA